MARPIRETPILFGEDARRFEERMKNPPKETPEEREVRLKDYYALLEGLKMAEAEMSRGVYPAWMKPKAKNGQPN